MPSLKIVFASEANVINKYKSIKSKVLNYNSNIYFNKQCILRNLTSKYLQITVRNTTRASRSTKIEAQKLSIEGEMKFFLHKKTENKYAPLCYIQF
jgi:hypothetical protein